MFERYSNPLMIARIRQYLREGAERWRMPTIAELVPGLIHFSLLLFFIGLADFLLHAYPIVGKFTLLPIAFCATLYIVSTLAPIFDAQSPYRTSLSGLVWLFTSWLRSQRNKRFGTKQERAEPLSSDMADEQMQLAMERTDKRRVRDKKAIEWLAEKLKDAEMESLTQGIPGSFNTGYGREIWNGHLKSLPQPPDETVPDAAVTQNDDPNSAQLELDQERAVPRVAGALRAVLRNCTWPLVRTRLDPRNTDNELTADMPRQRTIFCLPFAPSSPTSPRQLPNAPSSITPERVDVRDLCKRIQHLFETYDNRDRISDMEEWRKRSRACVETAASFVFCMGHDLDEFGDIGKLLSDLGEAEETSKWSETSLNRSFMTRWTCLSLVATSRMLRTRRLQECARVNVGFLVLYKQYNAVEDNSLDDNLALHNAKKIDEQFVTAWDCVDRLYSKLMDFRVQNPEEAYDSEAALEVGKAPLLELKNIKVDANGIGLIDMGILKLQSEIDGVSHRLTRQLPGVALDTLEPTSLANIVDFISNPIGPQLLYLRQRFHDLRNFSNWDIREVVPKILEKISSSPRVAVHRQGLMERQLWRLQDLSVGGAFGFTLELYFLVLRRLLPSSASSERDSREFATFYKGAFKTITDDWTKYVNSPGTKYVDSPGTKQIILNLVCDICVPDRGIFSNFRYPDIIMMELVETLRKMISGRPSPYIEAAMKELQDVVSTPDPKDFRWAAYEATLEGLRQPGPPNGHPLPEPFQVGPGQSQRRVGMSPTLS